MRWLLRKDLLILGRSRLLLVLLVVYPLVIAVLIGLALSRGPVAGAAWRSSTKPRRARSIQLGGQKLDVSRYANELLSQTDTEQRLQPRRRGRESQERGRDWRRS